MTERAEQLNAGDLATMTPEAINSARREGRLDILLGVVPKAAPPAPRVPGATGTEASYIAAGREDLVNDARKHGLIN